MLVLRLGELHQDDCASLSTTTDWLPLDDFDDDSLEGMELRCCPVCIDAPTGNVSVSELPRPEAVDQSADATQAVPGR